MTKRSERRESERDERDAGWRGADGSPGRPEDDEPIATTQPQPVAAPVIQNQLPSVSLTVYLTACGKKPDQTAGFRRWAQSRKLSPQTMTEWAEAWNRFQLRPIK